MSPRNGLLLYYQPHSYYSQRVLLALHEKGVTFSTRIVELVTAENYEAWFLQINSTGEVPVLQDGEKLISGSSDIIDYLEDNFCQGVYKTLLPKNVTTEQMELYEDLRRKIESIDVNILTDAAMTHRNLITKPRFPFNLPMLQKMIKDAEAKRPDLLKSLADANPDFSSVLLEKYARCLSRHEAVANEEVFLELLSNLSDILKYMEDILAERLPEEWLMGEEFTVVDVYLTALLNRMSRIGLENHLWGELPHLKAYFNRAEERPSCKAIADTISYDMNIAFTMLRRPLMFTLLTILTIVLVLVIIFAFIRT